METRKLYYENSHCSSFTARVLSCSEGKKGFEIILDATAFYPEGGGQAADTGMLNGIAVTDTREIDGQIVHFCAAPLEVGSTAEGIIDYGSRFTRMQQHSGEHIISGIIHRRYGWHNTGFHMSLGRIVIDFDGVVPPEDLPAIEAEANEAIWKNIPLHIWTPSPEELETVVYRTKRALPWPVRIVEVPGYDTCACCGTHVSATGEIGVIKLFSAIPFRGGTRMEMACGKPALTLLNTVFEQNRQVSRLFSAQIEQTAEAAKMIQQQLNESKFRCVQLQRQIFSDLAVRCTGLGNVLCFGQDLDSTAVRELADAIAEHCSGTAAVFSGSDSNYSYCLVAREGDLRPFGKEMNTALNGRGGGKPAFQQGSVKANADQIRTFFSEFTLI